MIESGDKHDGITEGQEFVPIDPLYRKQSELRVVLLGMAVTGGLLLLFWWQFARGDIRGMSVGAMIGVSLLLIAVDFVTTHYSLARLKRSGITMANNGVTLELPNGLWHLPMGDNDKLHVTSSGRSWILMNDRSRECIAVKQRMFPTLPLDLESRPPNSGNKGSIPH